MENPFADPAPSPSKSSWFAFKSPFSKAQPTSEAAEITVAQDDGEPEPESEEPEAPINKKEKAKLSKKEEELARREQELKDREAELQHQMRASLPRVPNFPFFWPLMHHNIAKDFSGNPRVIMLWMFRLYMFQFLTSGVNICAAFSIMISHPQGYTSGAQDFGVSIMYFVAVSISSFFLWYRPCYNAMLKESSMLFNMFFLFSAFNIAYCIYMALGIPASGAAGMVNGISVVTDNKYAAGVLCVVSTVMWIVTAVSQLILYRKIHLHYRLKGLTAEMAQQEATQTVAKSGVAQTAVRTYVKSSAGF